MIFKLTLLPATLLLATLLACSSAEEQTPTASPTPPSAATPSATELRVALAVSDLAVGPNRFSFGVLDSDSSPVRVPEATVSFLFLDTTPYETRSRVDATFVKWPVGNAGVYVANVSFDQAGRWGAVVEVERQPGTVEVGQAGFVVKEASSSPGIGRPAPSSRNKTARDVSDLSTLTTAPVPDPDLYQITIEEAVSSGKPTVVTFATPLFCQTATCGPQLEVVTSLKDRYNGQANFIHVEVYDNPDEMAGDISKGRLSPLMGEWGLITEPFTFVLDADGLIASKFEAFVTEAELEAALASTLDS